MYFFSMAAILDFSAFFAAAPTVNFDSAMTSWEETWSEFSGASLQDGELNNQADYGEEVHSSLDYAVGFDGDWHNPPDDSDGNGFPETAGDRVTRHLWEGLLFKSLARNLP